MPETFSVTPQYIWEVEYSHNVLKTTFESGKTQRRYKGARAREWNLTFKGAWSTVEAVVTFYNTRKGSYEAFNWTPPGESTAISVTFKENSLSITRHGLTSFGECSVIIEEVL